MKALNSNSPSFCGVARRIVLCCVGLLTVAFSGGALALLLNAQNGSTGGQSTKLG
jgi:hypothetical protein